MEIDRGKEDASDNRNRIDLPRSTEQWSLFGKLPRSKIEVKQSEADSEGRGGWCWEKNGGG